MKFVVFGDRRRVGLLADGTVLDLAAAAAGQGLADAPFGSLLELIEAGDRGLDLVEEVAAAAAAEHRTPVAAAGLKAPWPGGRFALAGTNNADHVATAYTNMGQPTTPAEYRDHARRSPPYAYWAIARPVMGPGDEIQIPDRAAGYFDYEGEPAIVIGRQGKDIAAGDIAAYVWGVTQVIDWSIRDGEWPPLVQGPLMLAKNFDTSKSIGPCIAVREADFGDFTVETIVNGEPRQRFSSKEMIFSFGELLASLSKDLTFYPGDVISAGTGAGTAIDSTRIAADGSIPKDRFLKAGDRVEVRSEAIGSLVGTCVPKAA